MTTTTSNILSVPFYGDKLFLVEHQGEPYTPMKPIVDAMGLDWKSQHRKISTDSMRWGMVIMTIPSLGGNQKSLCLPIRKLFGWMMTISPNKVKPEIRDKVIQYQNECDDILWKHWSRKNNLFKALEPQQVDKVVSLNHLQTICDHRRAAATLLYFFLQQEHSELAHNRWFNYSLRQFESLIGEFSFNAIGIALNYLTQAGLLEKSWTEGNPPNQYRIDHKVLKKTLRQHHLPSIQ